MTGSDDETWLDARERGESIDHVDPATQRRYEALQQQIAELPELSPPDGWQARVLERVQARARRTRWIGVAAGALAAAAVIVLVFAFRRSGPEPALEVSSGRSSAQRGDMLAVHDTLGVRVTALAEVRLYAADGSLLARCPRGPHCVDGRLELVLEVPGELDLIGVANCQLPEPSRFADDLARATEAKCTIVRRSLTVR